jgi:hypothetical protein
MLSLHSEMQEKVIHLDPPVLHKGTLLKEISCVRPMREGRFNIGVSTHCSKQIVNCYGHGGSGWTTLFGSVALAVRQMQEKCSPSQQLPLRIIGSGCMGLCAAIELKRLGYRVAGITSREFYDIPSWRAAGYFAVVSVKTGPDEQSELCDIGIETFKTCQRIESGTHPYIKEAVRRLPVYSSCETEAGVEMIQAKGLLPPPEEVTLDFGKGVRHPHFLKHITYFMDTSSIMHQLTAEVARLAIPIEKGHIHSFDEVKEELIFNCAGLGGALLCGDEKVIPVRGHLTLLNELAGRAHLNYMIYTKFQHEGKEEMIYLYPKLLSVTSTEPAGLACHGVLGGTFISGTEQLSPEELLELDRCEFRKLLDRNHLFFHGRSLS